MRLLMQMYITSDVRLRNAVGQGRSTRSGSHRLRRSTRECNRAIATHRRSVDLPRKHVSLCRVKMYKEKEIKKILPILSVTDRAKMKRFAFVPSNASCAAKGNEGKEDVRASIYTRRIIPTGFTSPSLLPTEIRRAKIGGRGVTCTHARIGLEDKIGRHGFTRRKMDFDMNRGLSIKVRAGSIRPLPIPIYARTARKFTRFFA